MDMINQEQQIKKSQGIWFAINKNDKVVMFSDEPTKNEEKGIWESKFPYVNSLLYKEICEMVKQAKMNFESEPQYVEIQIR